MKLKVGKPRYNLPPYSQILGVYVLGNQKHNQMISFNLYQVPIAQLVEAKPAQLAMPTMYSVCGDTIEFWPPPDRPYTVTVRYTTPVMEC